MKIKFLLFKFLFGCIFLFGAQNLLAQGSTTSSIRGSVTDSEGLALPGATVIAVHEPSGSEYANTTNLDGLYTLRNMRVGGPYTIRVTYIGFKDEVLPNINLQLSETLRLNIALSESSEALEEVVIQGSKNSLINGNKTGTSLNISNEEINAMPAAGRVLTDYARLTPMAYIANNDDDGPAISIAGQSSRYNAIFIDGAINNDVFGLSAQGTNGGQTGVSPISVDAIEQITIEVAPYDIKKSGFTGGSISAVTRSGTNDFEGSAYYFVRNQDLAGVTPTEDPDFEPQKLPDFAARTYGARLGGPIIEDELFFFVNVEMQDNVEPRQFNLSDYDGLSGNRLNELTDYLSNEFGYDAGGYRNNPTTLESQKIIAKLDWNINRDHKLSIRHSLVDAVNKDGFASNRTNINFYNNAEVFPSTTNSTALELNSNFGNDFSNNLVIGYTSVLDDRNYAGDPFPNVRIQDGDGNLRFGSESYSTGNILDQSVLTITDNFTWYSGKHSFTLGTANEFYSFRNLFIPQNFGNYTYNSLDAFLDNQGPTSYVRSYSLVDGPGGAADEIVGDESGAAAEFDAYQLGFYLQDEYQAADNLKLSFGVRLDIPKVTTPVPFADDVFETTIPAIEEHYDLNGATPGETPKAQAYFSPRFGFNWDVKDNKETQIRGGVGLFTGRVPFVWVGGMYNNNGTNVGRVEAQDNEGIKLPNGEPLPFRGDINNQYTQGTFGGTDQVPSGRLELFEEDFKYPRVLRTSLALDQKLPGGFVGTLEGVYTKNLNNITVRNVNYLSDMNTADRVDGVDDRPIYDYYGEKLDDRYTDILLVGNTSTGSSINLTAQLQRPFENGFTANVAYSYGETFTLNDGTSSQISSIWSGVENVNGLNNLDRSRSDFSLGHRVFAFLSYRKEYLKNLATTVSLFYNGVSGRPYSYTIGRGSFFTNDPGSDLFYVPASIDEANLVDAVDNNGNIILTAEQQWENLNNFIGSESYLDSRRGQYTERNGARGPFEHILDLKLAQEYSPNIGGKEHKFEVTLDLFNLTNFLNRNWGRRYNVGNISVTQFQSFEDADSGNFTPEFTYTGAEDIQELYDNDIRDYGINSSRWQAQLGFRYTF